jgi:hypothetical protein
VIGTEENSADALMQRRKCTVAALLYKIHKFRKTDKER